MIFTPLSEVLVLYCALPKFILFSITAFKLVIAAVALIRGILILPHLSVYSQSLVLGPSFEVGCISQIKGPSPTACSEASVPEGLSDNGITDLGTCVAIYLPS